MTRRRFGQTDRFQAWPDGFDFMHDPGLPAFEFPELDLSPALAERVREAAKLYRALKEAKQRDGKVLAKLRDQARALADLLASDAAAPVFTALTLRGPDPHDLIPALHRLESEAAQAHERQRNKGQKPKAVAAFAFIGRMAEIYRAAGGEIRAVHDVKLVEGQATALPDTPWVRFIRAAFAYAGDRRPPSSSTINRAVSEAR